MTEPTHPFDDIRALLAQLPPPSQAVREAVRLRDAQLVKTPGSLGRMEEIAEWLAVSQNRSTPRIDKPFTVLFAANNGIAERVMPHQTIGSARQKLELCAAGGAAVNQIAATYGIGLKVFELALDHPTADIAIAAALDAKSAAATFAFGLEAIAGEPDLLCLGAFGLGNDVVAAAVFTALWGGDASQWLSADAVAGSEATAAIHAALALNAGELSDPLEIMRRLGGRETCALAGAIAAARLQNIPVLLDGLADCAAAAILLAMDSTAIDHCMAAHVVPGGVHRDVLERLGKKPILDMGISSGEGAGATLAAGVLKAAVAAHNDMPTWDQARLQ